MYPSGAGAARRQRWDRASSPQESSRRQPPDRPLRGWPEERGKAGRFHPPRPAPSAEDSELRRTWQRAGGQVDARIRWITSAGLPGTVAWSKVILSAVVTAPIARAPASTGGRSTAARIPLGTAVRTTRRIPRESCTGLHSPGSRIEHPSEFPAPMRAAPGSTTATSRLGARCVIPATVGPPLWSAPPPQILMTADEC